MADYALLVGIDAYNEKHHAPLRTPVNDVEEIARLLDRDADDHKRWDTVALVGARRSTKRVTEESLTRALKDRLNQAAAERGHFLFYFAGHGRTTGLGGHDLVLQGADGDAADEVVHLRDVVEEIQRHPAVHSTTIILDCCYAGGIAGAPDFALSGNRAILTSSSGEAVDGARKHSPFAQYVIECLNGANAPLTGEVTITSVFEYVSRRFKRTDQRPHLKLSLATEPVVLRTAERLIEPGNLTRLFPDPDTRLPLTWEHEGPVYLTEGKTSWNCSQCAERRDHHHGRPAHAHPGLELTEAQKEFDELRRLYQLGLIHTRDNKAPYVLIQEGKDLWLSPLGQWYWHQRDLGWL